MLFITSAKTLRNLLPFSVNEISPWSSNDATSSCHTIAR